jgi:competence protein ComEC
VTVIAVSAACGLVTAPILWAHFGAVPVLSVAANVLAAPVVAPILGLGLGAAVVGSLFPPAAALLAWVNGWLVSYLAWCARAVGGLPFAQLESNVVLLGLAAAVATVYLLRRAAPWRRRAAPWGRRPAPWMRRGVLLAAVAAIGAVLLWTAWPRGQSPPPAPAGLRVTFLDVGQGDAVLLQVREGAVLVDQGPPEARVDDQLMELGVESLATLVLTHPQRDHVGGAAAVIRRLSVETVLDPRQPVASPFEEEAMAAAGDRHVRVITARRGQVLRLGRLHLRVLWPDDSARSGDDPNDHAIVLLASYGRVDVLLTADAETDVTGRLALSPVEVLKVAHHGSADPGLPALLARIRPQVAVISVGRHNDYGHPTDSTLAALRSPEGLEVYRTDEDGAIVLETDGTHIVVRTEA